MSSHDGRRAREAVGTDMPLPSPRPGPARMPTLSGHVSGGNKVENVDETQPRTEGSLVFACSS